MTGGPCWRSEVADSARRGLPIRNMAYKFREEIVGKRFLSVSGFTKLKVNKISEWGWRAGVIRAASHRDNGCPDLQVSGLLFRFFSIRNRAETRRYERTRDAFARNKVVVGDAGRCVCTYTKYAICVRVSI